MFTMLVHVFGISGALYHTVQSNVPYSHPVFGLKIVIFTPKLLNIVYHMEIILWVYYTIPFGFSLFRYFGASLINFNYFVWLLITDEGLNSTRNAHLVHIVN